MTARADHPIVRGQFVTTKRRPIDGSGLFAIRSCSGTDSKTVLARTTPRMTAPNQANHALAPVGRLTKSTRVVIPSVAIGRPTTQAVRRWCSTAISGARSTPMVARSG